MRRKPLAGPVLGLATALLAISPLTFSLLAITACTPANPFATAEPINRDPFFMQWGGDEGHDLSLEGPTRVLPGETITYRLKMTSSLEQPWQGEVCLVLLNREGVEASFWQSEFALESGSGEEFLIEAAFSGELSPDAYGLALVIPERAGGVTTIQVGQDTQAIGGPWPEAAVCPDEG